MESLKKFQFSQDNPSLYGIDTSTNIREQNDVIRASLLSSSLRVDRELIPEVFSVIDSVKSELNIKFDIEAYIYNDSSANACCVDYGSNSSVLILLSSGLIQLLTSEELRFVIGHEIGHYIYGHHTYPNPENADNKFSRLNLYELQRSAEISADRVGFICAESMESVFKTILKVSTGLPDSYFRFDFSSYIQQLSDLNSMGGNHDILDQTHPLQHIRLKSLLLFSMTLEYYQLKNIKKSSPLNIIQVDKKILTDLNASSGFLLSEIRNTVFEKAELWAFLSLALADKKLSKDEQLLIKRYFGEDTANKAVEFAKSHGPSGVQKKFETSIQELRNQPEATKISFLNNIDKFLSNFDGGSDDMRQYHQIIKSRLFD